MTLSRSFCNVLTMANVAFAPVSFSPSTSLCVRRGHGAVSEYEPIIMSQQISTRLQPEQKDLHGVPSPLILPPAPVGEAVRIQSDPTLSVTPDKITHSRKWREGINTTKKNQQGTEKVGSFYDTVTESNTEEAKLFETRWDLVPSLLIRPEPDPMLAITPDKSTNCHSSRTKSSLRKDGNVASGIDKLKQVRFNVNTMFDSNFQHDARDENMKIEKSILMGNIPQGKVEQLSNNDSNCPSLEDLGTDQEKFGKQRVTVKNTETVYFPSRITFEVAEAKCSLPDSNQSSPNRNVVVTREMQEQPLLTEYKYPFEDASAMYEEHVFSRPEFHNSLKVYNEMKAVGSEQLDIETAIQRHLCQSLDTKQDIEEKAAAKVNQKYSSNHYNGLVGLEASIEDLCKKTEKQMNLKVKSSKQQIHKVSVRQSPDLMEFFHSEREKEGPDFLPTSLSTSHEDLSTAPEKLAFDLYKHNRVWENISC